MKTCFILMIAFTAGSLMAQPDRKMEGTAGTTETVTAPHDAAKLFVIKPQPPNEIQGRRVTYSGVAVQAMKVKNPLRLLNPFAPVGYGSGEGNLDRDVITGQPTGFKFLSLKF